MERLRKIWLFYYEGFRDMSSLGRTLWIVVRDMSSLGRTLWIVVLLKLFIMFAVLRVFFFRPALADCETDAEKSQAVIENLIK